MTAITNALSSTYQSLKTSSFYTEVSRIGSRGVSLLSDGANSLRVNGGAALSKIAAFASSLFSGAVAKTGALLRAVRDVAVTALTKARVTFSALPKEAKLGAAVAMVGAALLAALYFRDSDDSATSTPRLDSDDSDEALTRTRATEQNLDVSLLLNRGSQAEDTSTAAPKE